MAQAAQLCDEFSFCEDEIAYAVAAGAISAFVCAVFLVLNFLNRANEKIAYYTSIGLFVWWIPAVGVLTFDFPFTTTLIGNGYFASWGCFLISLNLVHSQGLTSSQSLPSSVGEKMNALTQRQKTILLILVGSFVVMVAAADLCDDDASCKDEEAWAVAVGVISLVTCAVWAAMVNKLGAAEKFVAIFVFVLWLLGVGVCTVESPFVVAGNGYFGCWFCFILSGGLAITSALGDDSSGGGIGSVGGKAAPAETREARTESF